MGQTIRISGVWTALVYEGLELLKRKRTRLHFPGFMPGDVAATHDFFGMKRLYL
jgi:hypothetical protein